MTYRELWRTLTPLYDEGEARAITDYVLDAGFGMSKADIICGAVESLTADDAARLGRMFDRLRRGEPVQYVMGWAEFGGKRFSVRPGILIPRPETEELCALITADRQGCAESKIVDIGTGSGCIAVTLALDVPGSDVSAWDISPVALDVAAENAQANGASVTVERRDALSLTPCGEQWDVIVSNPPYICDNEKKDMAANVLDFEPATALFVPDDDPLRFYRPITAYAAQTLRPGGALYFELNPIYADDIASTARACGFTDVDIINDCYGKRRMMRARKTGRQ